MRVHGAQAASQPDNPEKTVNVVLSGLEVSCELGGLGQSDDDHNGRVSKDRFLLTSLKGIDASLQNLQGLLKVESGKTAALPITGVAIDEGSDREHHGMDAAKVADHVRKPAPLHGMDLQTKVVWIHADLVEIDDCHGWLASKIGTVVSSDGKAHAEPGLQSRRVQCLGAIV